MFFFAKNSSTLTRTSNKKMYFKENENTFMRLLYEIRISRINFFLLKNFKNITKTAIFNALNLNYFENLMC